MMSNVHFGEGSVLLFLRQERELEFPIGHIAHFSTHGFAFKFGAMFL